MLPCPWHPRRWELLSDGMLRWTHTTTFCLASTIGRRSNALAHFEAVRVRQVWQVNRRLLDGRKIAPTICPIMHGNRTTAVPRSAPVVRPAASCRGRLHAPCPPCMSSHSLRALPTMQAQRVRGASAQSQPSLSCPKAHHRCFRSAKHVCRAVQVEAQAVTQLLSWAKSKNIALDKISLVEDVADNRPTVVAAKDLSPGEAVLTVPQNTWVTPEAAQKSAAGQLIASLEPWLQVALLLLLEKSNAGSSNRQYLDSLPSSLDTPMFWSDKELGLLEGTQLLQNLHAYR